MASTFVSILEPYEKAANIAEVRRLPLATGEGAVYPDANVAVGIRLADGRRDVLLAADVENPLGRSPSWKPGRVLVQEDNELRLAGQLALIRFGPGGELCRAAVCRATSLRAGNVAIELRAETEYLEVRFDGQGPSVVSGPPEAVERILVDGRSAWPR